MTKDELALLRVEIRNIRKEHGNAWWELKRQIWDMGYHEYYPAQGEFNQPVRRMLQLLNDEKRNALIQFWKKTNPEKEACSDERILDLYEWKIIEELVRRARIAANRTENWY